MKNCLIQLSKCIDVIMNILIVIVSSTLVIVVFLNIVFRYLLKQPLSWSTEIAGYGLIWWVFLGSAIAIKKDQHISLGFLEKSLTFRIDRLRKKLVIFFMIFYSYILVYYSIIIFPLTRRQITPFIQIPLVYLYAIMPISGISFMIYLLEKYFMINIPKEIKNKNI